MKLALTQLNKSRLAKLRTQVIDQFVLVFKDLLHALHLSRVVDLLVKFGLKFRDFCLQLLYLLGVVT